MVEKDLEDDQGCPRICLPSVYAPWVQTFMVAENVPIVYQMLGWKKKRESAFDLVLGTWI